jgi:signal transduction histidine kinase
LTTKTERLQVAAVAAAGAVMTAIAAAVTLDGGYSDHPDLDALVRALSVCLPIAVGLYARRLPSFRRFGDLLVLAGGCWFLTTLAGSRDDLLYSTGRVSDWVAEIVLLYVLLAFPTGRLGATERRLMRVATAILVALWLPTALLIESYPSPTFSSSCSSDCPANAFMIPASEPGWVGAVLLPLREAITFAMFAAAAWILVRRIRRSSHVMRRTLAPVLSVAILRWAATALGLLSRAIVGDSRLTRAFVVIGVVSLPAIALAFLAGLVRWRLFIAAAMERLATRVRSQPGPDEIRDALAEAFDDPGLTVVYWLERPVPHWGDAHGRPVELSALAGERSFTPIHDGDRRVAAVLHDPALEHDPAFVASASTYAVMTLDNQRLAAQTAALLNEVRDSRARIQSAADDERRRIEQDLHDGAQQRLVALRIKLELAAERADGNGGVDATALRGFGIELEEALDDVRRLARGIYPAPLATAGVADALRSAALHAGLPVTVIAPVALPRFPRDVESAAYFVCLEAMQNAIKHAAGATRIAIEISLDDAFELEVRDDGAGFDPSRAQPGIGLTSMRDRLGAIGGTLELDAAPGRGTRVAIRIPMPAASGSRRPSADELPVDGARRQW